MIILEVLPLVKVVDSSNSSALPAADQHIMSDDDDIDVGVFNQAISHTYL